jgi:hypothetical protein
MRDYIFMPGIVMKKRICGVMVSMISTILEDCGFEPCSGQTNDYFLWKLITSSQKNINLDFLIKLMI